MARGFGLPARSGGVWRWTLAAALLFVMLAVGAIMPRPAAAAGITVNTATDSFDVGPTFTCGNVTISNLPGAGDGKISLREAICAANNTPMNDTITFTLPDPSIISLSLGELGISSNLTINGPGANKLAISGANLSRVFHLTAGNVTIRDVTIKDARGAAFGFGGGIFNEGATLTLRNSVVSNNNAAFGAGIFSQNGTVTIDKSTIASNTASGSGGSGGGGGIESYFATLTITDSTIDNNEASFAGGMEIVGGTVTITGTTISNNRGGLVGGGINFEGSEPGGTVTIANTTFSGNGSGDGGGIAVGIDAGTLTLKNVTMANNGGGRGDDLVNFATVNATNTIFGSGSAFTKACYTYTTSHTNSGGHNLARDASCSLTGTGDLPNTDPLLADLADYGGPTKTHALLVGSPAIGGGDPTTCTNAPVGAKDQRGIVRPQGTACDIGSYEALTAVTLAVPGVSGTYGGTVDITATLTNTGTALSGKKVCFTLSGTSLGCDNTNASGLARVNNVSLAGFNAGVYTNAIQAVFAGDFTNGPAGGNGTLTVNKANQTITFGALVDKTYGDAPFTVSATASSGLTVTFTASPAGNCAASGTNGTSITIAGAGNCTVTADQAGNDNYNAAPSRPRSFNIGKAPLTVTADPKGRPYGDPNPTFTATITGFVNNETLAASGVTGAPNLGTTATSTSAVGPYTITAAKGSLAATNYSFSVVNGTLTISQATLTVTAADKSRAYGDSDPAFTVDYQGFKNNETSVVLGGTLSCAATTTATSPAGSYPGAITCSGQTATNYALSYVAGKMTINKASLTVTADDQSRAYGDPNPTLTATFSDFKNGETLATSDVTGSPDLATAATATSTVSGSPYAITAALGTLASTNYSFNFANGQLAITPATLTVTANDATKVYGEPNPTFTAKYDGFKNNETFAGALSGAPALSTTATQYSPVGPYTISVTIGTLAANNGNYDFSFVNGTLSITRALLKVTVDNTSKPYSAPNPAFTVTFSGFLNNDTSAVVSGTPAFATSATQYSPVGSYTIVATLGTLSAANYDFGPFVDGTLTIVRATTALSSVSGSTTYGDTTGSVTATLRRTNGDSGPVAGGIVSFTVNGQAVCGVAGKPACPVTNAQGVATLTGVAFSAGLNAGAYPNIVGASYAGDTNHLASSASGQLVVGRKILWLKPVDRTVGLRQPNPPTDPHLDANCAAPNWCLELARGSTFVSGQSWSALNLTALRFQYARNPPSTDATEYVGKTYRITAFGASSGNYDIRYDPGTMTVK